MGKITVRFSHYFAHFFLIPNPNTFLKLNLMTIVLIETTKLISLYFKFLIHKCLIESLLLVVNLPYFAEKKRL